MAVINGNPVADAEIARFRRLCLAPLKSSGLIFGGYSELGASLQLRLTFTEHLVNEKLHLALKLQGLDDIIVRHS